MAFNLGSIDTHLRPFYDKNRNSQDQVDFSLKKDVTLASLVFIIYTSRRIAVTDMSLTAPQAYDDDRKNRWACNSIAESALIQQKHFTFSILKLQPHQW